METKLDASSPAELPHTVSEGLIKESTLVKRGANRIEMELLTRSKP